MSAGALTGRRILVTGASKGIGAAIARTVHRDGAEVAVHFNSDEAGATALAAELGERVHLVHGDLSDREAATEIWAAASSAMGGIDTLVNNAGAWIASPLEAEDNRAAGSDAWARGWDANLQLNLLSAADLCRQALLDFADHGGGAIINMTSRSAHRGDDAEHLAYGAAKAGLLSLTKGIARGYGHLGVCAYAIAPGWVDTGLAAGAVSDEVLAGLPLREVTPPEDVAELVAFLASGRARHLTGSTIDVTGADYVR
ncbi:SDR family NAD(P)-dependent oxidoreductase [Brevibacterium spongiae]|uniref:SDR family oxidoreductase n=1 Tax=Brevibacterium spongiae TaxID=2909672 RepID=A0ABY5SM60_9MICO|nr:SDR family oxidoreductase [Brevibacterium spongiae]UVI35640.1 SDR family oxidoreductase [Brevibacterium spongiae]